MKAIDCFKKTACDFAERFSIKHPAVIKWEKTKDSSTWVSNPSSGEMIKGHKIVAAELGLAPYVGKAPRSPNIFEGKWSKESRKQHFIQRMGFVRALFKIAGMKDLILYRGLNFNGEMTRPKKSTFVAGTTNLDIALSCFGDHLDSDDRGAIFRQKVPVERVFMTYFETDQLNQQYKESEVVLLWDEENDLF